MPWAWGGEGQEVASDAGRQHGWCRRAVRESIESQPCGIGGGSGRRVHSLAEAGFGREIRGRDGARAKRSQVLRWNGSGGPIARVCAGRTRRNGTGTVPEGKPSRGVSVVFTNGERCFRTPLPAVSIGTGLEVSRVSRVCIRAGIVRGVRCGPCAHLSSQAVSHTRGAGQGRGTSPPSGHDWPRGDCPRGRGMTRDLVLFRFLYTSMPLGIAPASDVSNSESGNLRQERIDCLRIAQIGSLDQRPEVREEIRQWW